MAYTLSQYQTNRIGLGSGYQTLDPLYDIIAGGLGGASSATGTGSSFYVDSNATGGDTGKDWTNAVLTLDAAINLCTADRGDWIHVAEGHAETISGADGWDADVAGITIYHHGNGSNQGTYTFSATGSTVAIGAANVTVVGGRFAAGVNAVVAGIMVEAAGDNCTLIGCDFPEPTTSSFEFVDAIDLASGTDSFSIVGCSYSNYGATGASHFIEAGNGANLNMRIIDCDIIGEFAISAIWSDTADLDVIIDGCTIKNLTTGQHCIEFTGAATGWVTNCNLYGDTEDAIIDPGSLSQANVTLSTAVDTPGNEISNRAMLGDFTGPHGGAAQDDNVKASLDLAHTDLDAILADTVALDLYRVKTISTTTDFTASTDNMFTVAGGPVEILSLYGLCTTLAGGSPGTMVIEMDATTAAQDGDFSTTVNVDALAAGDVIRFTNAIDEGVLSWTTGTQAGQPLNWFAPIGDIEQTLSSTGTGAVTWYMTYRALDASSAVTASA